MGRVIFFLESVGFGFFWCGFSFFACCSVLFGLFLLFDVGGSWDCEESGGEDEGR